MSSDLQTTSIRYAILSAGANPELARTVLDSTVAPVAQGEGYDVGSALYGMLHVHMLRGGPCMVADLYITTVDLTIGVTYGITVPLGAAVYTIPGTPPASLSALCEAIAANFNADAQTNTTVTATAVQRGSGGAVPGGTSYNTVRLTWLEPEPTTLAWAVSGATARSTVIVDPLDARVRVYGAWNAASVAARLTATPDYDGIERSRAWDILRGSDGTVADLTLTDGQGYHQPVYVADVASLRAYVTATDNALVTTSTGTTVTAITVQDPLVYVTYARVGA